MKVPKIRLNDGMDIPQLGYGVWKIADSEADKAVETALETGYRHIDTAKAYDNEEGVGRALKNNSVPRKEIFITTKLWNSDQGFDSTLKAFDQSMERLGIDYCDLYLIHWPAPMLDKYVESWRAMTQLKNENRVRSIGVSNFRIADLERLMRETGLTPAINQIELHPYFQQKELRVFHEKHHIATEAWSPIGRGKVLNDPALQKIAKAYNKTIAQIVLRWHMEIGTIAIPKTIHSDRMRENFEIFDFKLSARDHDLINSLDDKNGRVGPDPAQFS